MMPEPRGLHSFCGESCISLDIYDESHLLRQSSDQIFISDNTNESRMSADDESEIICSPSESDMNILQ